MTAHHKRHPKNKALAKVVAMLDGQTSTANLLSTPQKPVSQQRVWNWIYRGDAIPSRYVLKLEKAVGGQVTRHELDPETYPYE